MALLMRVKESEFDNPTAIKMYWDHTGPPVITNCINEVNNFVPTKCGMKNFESEVISNNAIISFIS